MSFIERFFFYCVLHQRFYCIIYITSVFRQTVALVRGCVLLFPQILVDTAQKRQALNEVEARHLEIIQLEANIRVSVSFPFHPIPVPTLHTPIPIPPRPCSNTLHPIRDEAAVHT